MEPKLIARRLKQYSELPPFQRAQRTEYLLCEADGELCLTVRADTDPPQEARCVLKGKDRQAGCALLQLLYENAVAVNAVPDIVEDLCAVL